MAMFASQAASVTVYNFFDEENIPMLSLQNGGLLTTLGEAETSGYLAIYWWSADDINYSAIGIGGFGDLYGPEFEGWFRFDSTGLLPSPVTGETTSYLGMTVFRYEPLLGSDGDAWWSFINGLVVKNLNDANADILASYWGDAQAGKYGGEIAQWWGAEIVIDYLGGVTPSDLINNGFGWNGQGQSTAPIPEPSTWLLLGAGAAFVVIMRRRKAA